MEEQMIKEYSLFAISSVILVYLLDRFIFKTHLFYQKKFWLFHLLIACIETLVNGYLTWRPVVIYNNDFFFNIRFFTIPYEDYFYGFGLITLNLILFEYFKREQKNV